MLEHVPYSPDFAPVNFFYFPKVKEALAGRTLTDSTFRAEWGRAAKTVSKDDCTDTFSKCLDCCKKCVQKRGNYVEKLQKK